MDRDRNTDHGANFGEDKVTEPQSQPTSDTNNVGGGISSFNRPETPPQTPDVEFETVYTPTTEPMDPKGSHDVASNASTVTIVPADEYILYNRRQAQRMRNRARPPGFGYEFYGRVADVRRSSTNCIHKCCFVTAIVCESIIGLGFLLLTTAIPVAMIAIGANHLHDCPAIPELPTLLIVSGSLLAFLSLINIIDELIEGYVYHTSGKRRSKFITGVNIFVFGLLIICLVLGCMWVYVRKTPPEYLTQYTPHYCHPAVYQFSFWLLNILSLVVIMIGALSFIGLIVDLEQHSPSEVARMPVN